MIDSFLKNMTIQSQKSSKTCALRYVKMPIFNIFNRQHLENPKIGCTYYL